MASEMTGESVSTVKLSLFESGIAHRELFDRIRFDRAREMLLESQMAVREI